MTEYLNKKTSQYKNSKKSTKINKTPTWKNITDLKELSIKNKKLVNELKNEQNAPNSSNKYLACWGIDKISAESVLRVVKVHTSIKSELNISKKNKQIENIDSSLLKTLKSVSVSGSGSGLMTKRRIS
ncbi:hypothetical protein BB561_005864 [Smittium simulii]|uniref:Uncharacterized protein n=1 Tax=Smittium simulii TaxID=133385 RepID=A0A2T9Y805_9FUNG|nr:hypothetical protein BB561_005864 [Smittium simulii]